MTITGPPDDYTDKLKAAMVDLFSGDTVPEQTDGPIDREEFLARFKAELIRVVGEKSDDGEDVAGYADDVGPTYWDDPQQRAWGPEECALDDLSYWGDE